MRALLTGHRDERAIAFRSNTFRPAANFANMLATMPLYQHVVLATGEAHAQRARGIEFTAISEGNRCVILPDVTMEIGGREYALSVKGAGALLPPYGDSIADEFALPNGRFLARDPWLGESPYGGQGEEGGSRALAVTELADGANIAGFYIAPTIALAEVPSEFVAHSPMWYRRFEGRVVQEHRLVPSDVRVFHASPHAVARNPDQALALFELDTDIAFDAFVERLLASGFAALTLYARTLREGEFGPMGLDFQDVWLDKDSVVARDGTLHFVDLEAIDFRNGGKPHSVENRIRRQFERNAYELYYAVDALLRADERRRDRVRTPRERRQSFATRLELALARDPFVRVERQGFGLDLWVRPTDPTYREVRIAAIAEEDSR